jgi:asparagine synthase (glutamine-hydrolysing)
MFAFAVADERGGKLLLARDHMGIKPLYHCRAPNGGLIFASEMKSLLLAPSVKREIDPEALDLYLSYLYIPEPSPYLEASPNSLPATSSPMTGARAGPRSSVTGRCAKCPRRPRPAGSARRPCATCWRKPSRAI